MRIYNCIYDTRYLLFLIVYRTCTDIYIYIYILDQFVWYNSRMFMIMDAINRSAYGLVLSKVAFLLSMEYQPSPIWC